MARRLVTLGTSILLSCTLGAAVSRADQSITQDQLLGSWEKPFGTPFHCGKRDGFQAVVFISFKAHRKGSTGHTGCGLGDGEGFEDDMSYSLGHGRLKVSADALPADGWIGRSKTFSCRASRSGEGSLVLSDCGEGDRELNGEWKRTQ